MKGRPPKKARDENNVRRTFLIHPSEEMARKIESICRECEMSANAVITQLIDNALCRMTLTDHTVQRMSFEEKE